MTRLLNKPLKTFIIFTCTVLACSIPAYFYLVESIWTGELDDHNQHLKTQIEARFNAANAGALDEKIALWNEIQSSSQIMPALVFRKDSVYITEKEIMDRGVPEAERFRGLFSVIRLNGHLYSVTIESNVEEVHETVFAISIITCLFILLLISGFILLNRRLSQRLWMPFTDTLKKLQQFDLGSAGTITFSATDIQEFNELNKALGKLIDNNIRAYTQQKEFTQNASHELQTPLALLKTKLDLLIQDTSLTADQRKIIESLDKAISRVTRINKNLLLLAGIEHKNYEAENVDVSKLVRAASENFNDFARDKGCVISTNIEAGIIKKANESLLDILVSNLLSNTIRHGEKHCTIGITLTGRALVVANEGGDPLKEENLFKRFIAAGTNNPGTGLGLAIVKEICNKYGWQVTYNFAAGRHIFSVFF